VITAPKAFGGNIPQVQNEITKLSGNQWYNNSVGNVTVTLTNIHAGFPRLNNLVFSSKPVLK
jgi:hypothetical protein